VQLLILDVAATGAGWVMVRWCWLMPLGQPLRREAADRQQRNDLDRRLVVA